MSTTTAKSIIQIDKIKILKKVEWQRPPFWQRFKAFLFGRRRLRWYNYTLVTTSAHGDRVKKGDLILGQANTGWEVMEVSGTSIVLRSTKPLRHCQILGNAIVVGNRR